MVHHFLTDRDTFFSLLLVITFHAATRRSDRQGAAVLVGLTFAMFLYQKWIDLTTMTEERAQWDLARSYIETIHASHAQTVLVLDDASGGFV